MAVGDYSAARNAAQSAARTVATALREGFGAAGSASYPGANAGDVVTEFDRVAMAHLQELLCAFDSGIGFAGEDVTPVGSATTFWLVDALGSRPQAVRFRKDSGAQPRSSRWRFASAPPILCTVIIAAGSCAFPRENVHYVRNA